MKCFYHSADLDGHCSGAIIKNRFPEVELVPIDYKDEFPFGHIKNTEQVILVDFSLQMPHMTRLNDMCKTLIWLDHHKTAIEAYQRGRLNEDMPEIDEVHLDTTKAGCEIAWDYCYPNAVEPLFVRLLGRYDVWDHQTPWVLPFQFAMRSFDTDPREDKEKVWKRLFSLIGKEDKMFSTVKKLCADGNAIMRYKETYERQAIEFGSFPVEIAGHQGLAINHGRMNYRHYDTGLYDLMVTFQRIEGKWRVSLYSDKIDVGALAKQFGGGGHKGAAGFVCETLPFQI